MPLRHDVMPAPHGCGCNMAIRHDITWAHVIWSDERLPLNAWSEDMDFIHRLGRHGRIVKLGGTRRSPRGQARTAPRAIGRATCRSRNRSTCSRKGNHTLGRAARNFGRNVAANLVHSVWPEPWIDRRGHLLGDARAVADNARSRLKPERILEL